ncbi:MAG: hypothetical protein ABSF65_06655 [Candidatus Bathyarchaeia archaeon]|jgi:uncharacterized protein YacL
MNSILTGIGILLFIVGLVLGVFSGIGLVHNVTSEPTAITTNWHLEAVTAIAFMVIGVLMVTLGFKKF